MENERIRYFIAVVEEGSISGAARRMHMSQPPVSLQIQNLEAEYNTKLFERSRRGVELTDAGRVLYAYALRMQQLEAEAREELKELHAGRHGHIRIGVISSGTCSAFLNGLRIFNRRYPNVQFSVFDNNTYQLLDDLHKERIDLAVIRTPFSHKGLASINLQSDCFAAAGRAEKIKALAGKEIYLKNLQTAPLIIYRRWEKIIRDAFEKDDIEPEIICINDDARTCLQWAEAGIGIALVPQSILSAAHHLEAVRLKDNVLASTICLVRRDHSDLSEAAEAFWQIFAKKMSVLPEKSSG